MLESEAIEEARALHRTAIENFSFRLHRGIQTDEARDAYHASEEVLIEAAKQSGRDEVAMEEEGS